MANPNASPQFDVTQIWTFIADVVKFFQANPNAIQDIMAFIAIVQQIIAAFNKPATPAA